MLRAETPGRSYVICGKAPKLMFPPYLPPGSLTGMLAKCHSSQGLPELRVHSPISFRGLLCLTLAARLSISLPQLPHHSPDEECAQDEDDQSHNARGIPPLLAKAGLLPPMLEGSVTGRPAHSAPQGAGPRG
uniref:Uncharacterized protein n=1 Tax=Pelusios castaneus TaxID=367368 RepID=A0A8C8RC99_9SAUR